MCIVTGAGVSAESCLQFANDFSVNHRRSYALYLGSSARKAWRLFLDRKVPITFRAQKARCNPLVLKAGLLACF